MLNLWKGLLGCDLSGVFNFCLETLQSVGIDVRVSHIDETHTCRSPETCMPVDPKILAAAATSSRPNPSLWAAVAALTKEKKVATMASGKGTDGTGASGSPTALASVSQRNNSVQQDTANEANLEMQSVARQNVKRVLDEHEKFNSELENKKTRLDSCSIELMKCEMLLEHRRQKLEKEKKKNDARKSVLLMVSEEQRKADENISRLVEELKREKEEALNKIKELNVELKKKVVQRRSLEKFNSTLLAKERRSNEELQRARQKLKEHDARKRAMQLVSKERCKAPDNVIRQVEELKREKEEAFKKINELNYLPKIVKESINYKAPIKN